MFDKWLRPQEVDQPDGLLDDQLPTVGRPDLVEPRLTEQLARAQHVSAHRLADEPDDEVPALPTHGFGSFCSSSQAEGDATTIGQDLADPVGQARHPARRHS
ncbi:hypothetical protein Stube_05170 [Streptomyces tubercidicus]|uniref:Uncharacterized protein n=1 Tax=Streptomyces tubercidicus TaxID=47759 RepID=A0A640UKI8_9ACTN|nr:hypothetical protein Stube_05170 [Streptomyces tubercidicus]